MTIRDWPEGERPREKLLAKGAAALSDAELLAIFLRTGVRGKSAVDVARELLTHFGGLRALFRADLKALRAVKGLGTAKYTQLQATLEMARRHLSEELKERDVVRDPASARRYLVSRLRDREQEVFAALFLDSQHRVIACEELAVGTLDGAAVYPREVVKRALALAAAAVILAHNHPSGVAEPSSADRVLTDKLKAALALVEIRVLDHLVIGERTVAFSERGWL